MPTSELVLASLDGTEQRHPVFQLAELTRSPRTVSELRRRGVEEITVAVDDLAVSRSWMLPSGAATVADLWPGLRSSLTAILAEGPVPCRVVLWSQLVEEEECDYEAEVARVAVRCGESSTSDTDPLSMAFGAEIAKRRRFERATGRGDDEELMRRRAADQVANYAVQGQLLRGWGLGAYLAWTAEEIDLMATVESGFTASVLSDTYGAIPQGRQEPWGVFPPEFGELREELRLYADDLGHTPGAVRPELISTLLVAVGQLLTRGTQGSAARQIRAFNSVLSGGRTNRARTEKLLEEALSVPARPGWEMEHVSCRVYWRLGTNASPSVAPACCR
ncbi:hypothetical protein [Nocardiopsis sp. M1B1]|uniref:hypothetical protein n=1 Tax=Nocardiopsis sp. M1B1 TaxID=3450454 RepID=UPI0040394DBE